MNKVFDIIKGSPIKLILIALGFVGISHFLQKPFPNIFMGLRLLAFILLVYGVIRLINRK
ncbi:hypothetical protein [Flavobacterium sp.]|jgi:hypothetical protein|uniref:hypothetical protein n=1 Tax=Flavobacterium sp. TaxID=239 RepID=UPI0037C0F0D3